MTSKARGMMSEGYCQLCYKRSDLLMQADLFGKWELKHGVCSCCREKLIRALQDCSADIKERLLHCDRPLGHTE